ncbi:MAG: hypothetical protein A3I44_00420 [Candidatus Sungbacteria bacterium RIFCSPLOWO2_02_FULL_51_17]|uniref:Uncharacterized protein n=1 Tax=Candidatus Sungbacteria bacterium RIFCSPHIGHO2_02_FULL_51_29 TaxID=1802273 RepID=A0A1G2KPF6_9BACT|nr:MAG: hypothetical protein A2676_04800 [Candidatus Sungbacteria bacterium RIFCSPHIGHO2_01_FULL_51_22]OHA01275.1 MAG: hypothetical protein A3C16_01900 [Candidatus Sungbacteria bacterium RIFCSPHIGHO2_02_FULL_51_29]OHA07777.1 MAG: hypothetical protein A3B29_00630 [Candidatus Sungbacteria bacterium RIFCSPLOWO2_01_FULL_51_34]OHA12558.1 MAG: hypothetical protein A3I44_00420 [Candidatus Sungbacteria bacterium RIFCSPLOWO2_02_FULL_51_17]
MAKIKTKETVMRARNLGVVVSALFIIFWGAGCASTGFQPDHDPVSYLFGTWETVGMVNGSSDKYSGHRVFIIPPQAVAHAAGERDGTVAGWYGIPGRTLKYTEFAVELVGNSVQIKFFSDVQSRFTLLLVGPDWLEGSMKFPGDGQERRVTFQKKRS